MNQKAFAELRRRFRPEKSDNVRIRGCYINEKHEPVSEFASTIGQLSLMESECVLALIKKTLSGTVGKHLIDVAFSNEQVMAGEEHALLSAIRKSALENDEAVTALYQRIVTSLSIEGAYIILLAYDNYGVPTFHKDGTKSDDSFDEFPFFVCSICPVKNGKPALSYRPFEAQFQNLPADNIVGAPEVGFLFPAFEDRSANIYSAVYYSRSTCEMRKRFIDTLFRAEIPMPPAAQKEKFTEILEETVATDCSIEVVQAVHDHITELIEEHKVNREVEPLLISRETVARALTAGGVSDAQVAAFSEKFDAAFGEHAEITPQNIVDAKTFEVKSSDVSIRVNPERSDLVETRMIDGRKYILIRADDAVEVNGVQISIR